MQRLDRPSLFDKLARKIVQQIGIGRRLSHHAEVIRCADQSFAEMPVPDAVYKHSRGKRVVRLREPVRQFQASTAFRNRGLLWARKNQREALGSVFSERVVVSAN